jgi:hypothetical protein
MPTRPERLDPRDLPILGAREKLYRLRSTEARIAALRRRLADRILTGDLPVDLAAADDVKRTGWARP